jgi:RimJ/RimL family protein N-acetyltransferase
VSRIVLRDVEAADLIDICEMESDIRVREFIGGVRTREQSLTGLKFLLANLESRWVPKAVCLAGQGKMIGYCGLQPLDKEEPQRIEVFYGLNAGYWGHGYATQAVKLKLAEAFETGIDKVYARVDGKNKRSIALVVKLGFAIEGERYDEKLKKNEILFSLEKPE